MNSRSFKPWMICLGSALFYFFVFFQLPMFNTIGSYVLNDFNLTSTSLGYLSSSYFFVEAIMLIPAVLILDRVSARKLAIIVMLLCLLSTFWFSRSHSFGVALVYRAINGIGNGVAFLVSMKLASRWLPKKWLALGMCLIMTFIMLGGIIAQTPFELLISHVGWRNAVLINACVGSVFFIYLFFSIQDHPSDRNIKPESLLGNLKRASKNPQNWYCAFYTSLMNLPVVLLGELWGVIYLVNAHHFSRITATSIASMIFLGTVVGSTAMGWISDMLRRRRSIMRYSTIITLMLILSITYSSNTSAVLFALLFFLLGFFASAQMLSFPLTAESNPPELTNASMCIIAVMINVISFIAQPFYGWLMRLHGSSGSQLTSQAYSTQDFQTAMLIFPAVFIICFLFTLVVPEKFSQPVQNH